ncbi:MAG: M1 family peptidase, partial [Gloeobacteraceae cyanobacterium ES-bin-316]|nr:M1 family peptidase [Ferruginibacter sp.]
NNITTKDIADMWVHESFTNYSETLFTDYYFGKEAGNDYNAGNRSNISNTSAIIGPYGVNEEGSGDMYDKGGNMLHNIRQLINNDEKFRKILRGLNSYFYQQTVTSAQVENYMSSKSGKDLSKIFDQYLRQKNIPVLEYKMEGKTILYRWAQAVEGFDMPVKISLTAGGKQEKWIYPTTGTWKKIKAPANYDKQTFKVNRNFYVFTKKIT